MKSPATITALNSMKQSHPKRRNRQEHYPTQPRRLPQLPQLTMSSSGRRLGLWMLGITLGVMAVWLLVTSVSVQWQLGIFIAGAWIATILFNLYSLNYLAGQATAIKRKESPQKRVPSKPVQRQAQPAFNFSQQAQEIM